VNIVGTVNKNIDLNSQSKEEMDGPTSPGGLRNRQHA
jgi:hypothetical protein